MARWPRDAAASEKRPCPAPTSTKMDLVARLPRDPIRASTTEGLRGGDAWGMAACQIPHIVMAALTSLPHCLSPRPTRSTIIVKAGSKSMLTGKSAELRTVWTRGAAVVSL